MLSNYRIALIGNPNCGKTTFFNLLTGLNQKVGNWPGVTIEQKKGKCCFANKNIEIIDLPGLYCLDSENGSRAGDEKIAGNFISENQYDAVINVIDASNLERGLYLTTQLLELNKPMIVVLNMIDVAKKNKISIDIDKLSEKLGIKILTISASKHKDRRGLLEIINNKLFDSQNKPNYIRYNQEVENMVQPLTDQNSSRWLALQDLKNNNKIISSQKADIAKSRYYFIDKLIKAAVINSGSEKSLSDKIDHFILNRFFGIPIFLAAMYLMFFFVINIGGTFIDFFDILFGAIFVDGARKLLSLINAPEALQIIMADGIGGGIQIVATFIPIIGCLYIFLSILEDSGYMARAALIMNRSMNKIGLSGKAFVPLILGFGCSVPAIMSSRVLESPKDRLTVIMMSPFFSCGAKLPVYALFAAAFFSKQGQNIVFSLYLIGIVVAIITGLIIKKLFNNNKQEHSMLLIELPQYHLPSLRSVIINSINRIKLFVFNAGKLIVIIVTILTLLNSISTDGEIITNNYQNSILSKIGQKVTYLFIPIDIKQENWPAGVGIFTGIFAKEVLVGTLDNLYNTMEKQQNDTAQLEKISFLQQIKAAFLSIPQAISNLKNNIYDPIGINIGDISNQETAAKKQEINVSTLNAMQQLFVSKISAFAYLLFILLYTPCTSALGAIYRELNLRWALIVAAYSTYFAYMTAVIFYQSATFLNHPITSGLWIAIFFSLSYLAFTYTKNWYQKQPDQKSFEDKLKMLPGCNKKCSKTSCCSFAS